MLSRVLVPMDGSELSEQALEYALENHPEASVTVLTPYGRRGTVRDDGGSDEYRLRSGHRSGRTGAR